MIANAGKRFLSLLLAIVMVVGMVPQIPLAAKAAVNGSFTITNLTASSSDGTWTISDGNTISTSVKSTSSTSCGNTTYTTVSTTVTLTNGYSEKAKLEIAAVMTGGGTISGAITETGSKTLDIEANSSVTITVTSKSNSTDEVKLTLTLDLYVPNTEQAITNTYLPAENGSYSVDGETVDADGTTVGKIYGYTSTLKVVSPADGYKFFSWYNVTTGTYVSDQEEYTITYEKETQIKPVFMRSDGALFGVGTATFCDLTEAVNYAQKTSATKIVLLNNGTLYGNHTIPSGVTLLIPFDAANTCYEAAPGYVAGGSSEVDVYETVREYRTLTMASGATLTVKGKLSLSAKHRTAQGFSRTGNAPTGDVPFIRMNADSKIEVASGGFLYAWGFITGSGTVDVQGGGTVYENMQVADFRGGNVTSDLVKVFPFSQYYLQNIEVATTYHDGSALNAFASVEMSSTVFCAPVKFIGSSGSLFTFGDAETYVTKKYVGNKDRLEITANGDVALNSLTLKLEAQGTLGGIIGGIAGNKTDYDSSNYILPITNNMTIKLESGNATVNQDMMFQPGAELIVGENATVTVSNGESADGGAGYNIFVMDVDQWQKNYVHDSCRYYPVKYAPGRTYTRTDADLKDVIIDVQGTVYVDGYLYTSESGARIISSNDKGIIALNKGIGTRTEVPLCENNSTTLVSEAVTSAQLQNGDGSYTQTDDGVNQNGVAVTYGYHSILDKWVKMQPVTVTYNGNGGTTDAGETTVTQTEGTADDATPMLDGLTLKDDKTFTKDGNTFTGWNTAADGTGTAFAAGVTVPTDSKATMEFITDTTLYAQWSTNTHKFSIDYNRNDGAAVEEHTVAYGDPLPVVIPETPERPGYNFTGWVNMADGSLVGTQENPIPTNMPDEDLTLQAQWTIGTAKYTVETYTMNVDGATYQMESAEYEDTTNKEVTYTANDQTGFTLKEKTVKGTVAGDGSLVLRVYYDRNQYDFNLVDGETTTTTKVYYGAPLTMPEALAKEGHKFEGWTYNQGALPETMPAFSVTLTAQWTVLSYDAVFDANGGAWADGSTSKTVSTQYGVKPSKPADPERAGYIFNGWTPDLTDMGVNGQTYTAQWTADTTKYNIYIHEMDLNGRYQWTDTKEGEGTTGDPVAYTPESKEGFTVADDSILTGTVAPELELEVYYSRNKYTLTTIIDGVSTPVAYYYEAPVTVADPTKEGHEFAGWVDGEGNAATIPATMPANDLTVEATWNVLEYTLTFDANGGTYADGTDEKTLTGQFGADIGDVEEPTKEGSEFLGWEPENPDTFPAVNQTYTAKWSDSNFTLTFDAGEGKFADGESKATVTGKYKDSVTAPADPTRTGYTFDGWDPAVPNTMPAGSQTYTAKWKINTYTVTWNVEGTKTTETYEYGATPAYKGETPTKAGNAQYTYTFAGWDPVVEAITGDTTYTATFNSTVNTYTITWVDYNGVELDKQTLDYGATPEFSKDEPTREQTDEFTYTFAGWTPTVAEVTGNQTYTAQYTATKRSYSVTFQDVDGTTLQSSSDVEYGTIASYTSTTTPSKTDNVYTYTFAGWDGNGDGEVDDELKVTGTMIFKPVFTTEYINYTVTWVVDGADPKETTYHYGDMPAYEGTPSKAADAQFTYTFAGWSPAITEVTGNAIYTAQFDSTVNEYTIKFVDEDGTTVLQTGKVAYGETPSYTGETPTKVATAEYTYTFAGWETEVVAVTGEATYKATYTSKKNSYTITWQDDEGGTIDTTTVEYGTVPTHADPTKAATAEYTYTFAGWTPEVVAVTGVATYKATYTSKKNSYTITWQDDGGSTIDTTTVEYGTVPTHADPTKAATAEYTYTFAGWTPEVVAVTGTATYKATYTETINKYTIKFVNEGTELWSGEVAYGETPSYTGETPTKAEDDYNTYTFSGWTPTISSVTGAQTYTATYAPIAKMYKIVFLGANGNEVYSISDGFDKVVTYTSKPSKAQDAQYTYTFAGWKLATWNETEQKWIAAEDAELIENGTVTVTGDATYVPEFTSTIRSYTITWLDEDGNLLGGAQTLDYGTNTPYTAQTKENTAQYTYAFAGWNMLENGSYDDEIEIPADATSFQVEGDATYKAVFDKTLNKYTITWRIDGAETTEEYEYGATPAHDDPGKESSATTDYTFSSWSPAIDTVTADQTYTAVFTESVRKYTVTWNVDGSTTTEQVANGEEITAPADPSKEHYTFAGWNPVIPEQMPTNDIEFTATWTPVTYTIQWDTDGDGTMDQTEAVAYGDPTPAVTGSKETDDKYSYTFTGWNPVPTDTVEGNAEYTAQFDKTPVDYSITFDANGGSAVGSITQGYGTSVAAPTEPTRAGYTFAGWFDGENEVTFPVNMPVGGMELIAEWTAIKYTITFDENDGSEVTDITQDYETNVTSLPTTTRTGYTFDGWYDGEGNKVEASEEKPLTMPLGGVTLTAKWTPNTYKLIYHSNYGDPETTKDQEIKFDATITEMDSSFTREGYTFQGWSKDSNATNPTYKADGEYTHGEANDVDLYAVWQINQYDITFVDTDGSEIDTITQEFAASVEKPADPEKEGHTFAGWTEDGAAVSFPYTVPAKDVTLTASWTVNSYKVKFVDDDGTTVLQAEAELAYGSTITAPADPTKATTAEYEYTFEGWDYNGDNAVDELTVKAQDMTFVAVYSKLGVEYSIYWDTNGDDIPDRVDAKYSTVRYGEAVETPEPAEIEGYEFVGWGGKVPATMPANDLMFKAQYKIKEYTVTFETDGGTEIATQSVPYGGSITVPDDPEKENHLFNGWTITGESGKAYDEIPVIMPAENLTFTANWLVEQATFVFYSDKVIYHSYQLKDGDTAENILPANSPSKDGYTFLYWSESENGAEVKFDDTLDLTVGRALYAVWKANDYKITIDENGGNAVADLTAAYESSVELPTVTRAGYTFAGWQDADGNAVTSPVTMPLNGMTVVAQWTADAKEYKVETYLMGVDGVYPETATSSETKSSFTDESASVSHETVSGFAADTASSTLSGTIPAEGTLTLKLYYARNQYTLTTVVDSVETETKYYYEASVMVPETPTKTGYTFASWSPEIPETMPAEDVEVTAQWTVNEHTVTWKAEGRKISQDTYAYGQSITASMQPAKEGYTFAGWFDENDQKVTFPVTMGDADRSFNAKFTINSYTVTVDQANGKAAVSKKMEYKAEITEPAEPSREGYAFTGWFYEDGTQVTFPAAVPAEDITLTAGWQINQYTITFDSNGGSAVKAVTQDYGTSIEEPAAPVKEGYTFAGWTKNGKAVTFPVEVTAENVTLTASWTVKEYTVTWIVDGAATEETYAYGAAITAPAPTKEGYDFNNWDAAVPGTMPAENLTFVAQWKVKQFTVTWNVDDTETQATYDYGAEIELPAVPTKEGYTFASWGAEVPETMPAENLTYTAQWTINSHTVTWKLNNGEEDVVVTYSYGDTISKPADPEKEGHSFDGWNAEAPETMPDNDLVYTAKWNVQSYTVQWKTENSTTTATYNYGDEIEVPAAPTKYGHTFAGWSVDKGYDEIPASMPAVNLIATATWTANQHTVTWNVDGDETVETYAYGDSIQQPETPTKEGYTFAGWTPAVESTMPDKDLSYTAQWTVKQHTVTWKLGNGEENVVDTYDYGATIVEPEKVEKQGYTFAGWMPEVQETMPDENLTYTAQWTINQYTISFDTAGGSQVEEITQNYNTYIRKPANPTREGYTFNGWRKDGAEAQIPSYMPAESYTLTADWTVNTYKITWNVDGTKTTTDVVYGTTIEKTEDGYSFAHGDETVTVENPAKEGYTFTGWSAEVPATMPAQNLTFVAEWSINTHTVIWDVDGTQTTVDYAYGKTISKPAAPTKTGYTFAGWGAEVPATMPDADLVFTAQWTINTHTVTWIADGVKTVESYEYGAQINKPADPEKEGHRFDGWTPDVASTMPDEDLTYTAQWTANSYGLTWDVDGKTETRRQAYGTAITKKADPSKEGYTFVGWARADAPNTVITVPATMPAEDLTLVAVWSVNKHTVTWNVNGTLTTETYAYGDVVTAPVTPEKEGYTFAGWSPKVTTMGDANVTYTATWTVNEYTITWNLDNGTEATQTKVAYGDVITAQTPVKEGYSFTGWTVTGAESYETAPKKMPAEDLNYTAGWTISSYTVTWNVDGKLSKESYEYSAEINMPADPEKTGYVFASWDPAVPATMPAENKTFTAVWNKDVFTVTWIVDGVETSGAYEYGAAISVKEAPVKEGWTFAGWKVTSGSTSYIPNTMPAEDLEITAQWTQNKYTVTWNVDGKTTTQTYLYGDTITAPADPEKEGYTFNGWSPKVSQTMGDADVTYSATWTVNSHTITWIVDNRTTTDTYNYGDTIQARTASKAYHTFAGWGAEVPATMPDENLIFTAQWDPDDYIITFHANNGTDEKTEQTVEHNVAEALDANPFTYEGYGFVGWATDKDSTETPYKNGDTIKVTTGMNLYAVWKEGQYTITWNVDGAETTSSCKYGTTITLPTTPQKEGYTFAGWLDEDGNKVTASTKMPARNLELTASWNINYYDISWDTNGDGTVDEMTSVAYGEMPAHADGSRSSVAQYDYTFTGWSPELTAVTGNAAYRAQFTSNVRSYNVTFVTNAEGITVNPITALYGDSITLRTLTREGYTFKGWSTNAVASEGAFGNYRITGETTLYAIWSANTYQISFVNEFGDTLTYKQYYGTPVELPEEPVQEGYTFNGWVNQKDATAEIPSTMPAAHLTFVADWTINQYTITFANTGDSTMDSITADYGTAIVIPADPVRVGYTFVGWDIEIPETMPAKNLTITAKWERNVYTIRWDVNGDGTVDLFEMEVAEQVEHGRWPLEQVGRKSPDQQYTYIFTGWTPEVKEATQDQVYVAQFTTTINKYSIGWDFNGDGAAEDTTTVSYGSMPAYDDVKKKSDEKYTYTFTGWYPELTEVTGDTMYTAQFDAIPVEYTINFLLDQNGGIVKSITAGYGTSIEVPDDPEKTGYTFIGWDKDIPATMPVGGATITGLWTINSYTITFDSDGGTEVQPIKARFGGAVTAPENPTKTGYTFAGWLPAVPATMPAENMTLTAQWTPNQYTISFSTAGGSEVPAITQAFGFEVSAPADPVREGYSFAGWTPEIPATMPAENITLTAQWTANPYDIRFYADEGDREPFAVVTADCDAGFNLPAEPTREGYNFGGWFWTDEDGNEVAVPTIMPAGGLDVYAKWTAGTFTIQFNTDGGTVVEPIVAEYGAEITAPADPEKEGYTFDGWDVEFPDTMPAHSMTLNAVWKINQYTIRFNTNGGTEIASITQDYNTPVSAPSENPTKVGYTFIGWDAAIPTVMPAYDMTVNAQWTANRYTITFNTNGGSAIDAIIADFGTAVTEPAAPVKTGYVFAGWDVEFPETMPVDGMTLNAQWAAIDYAIYWDTDGDGEVDDTTQVPYDTLPEHADGKKAATTEFSYVFAGWDPEIALVRGTATYTALFTNVPNTYSITFDTAGGSEMEPVTYAYGSAVAEPAAPSKEGYVFAGWGALPVTMPAENITVVAQWRVVDYSITFDSAGGTEVAPITAGYLTAIAAPNDPTREGYTFNGWSPAFPETMPLNGAKLTATWKVNQYTIRFNTDGGNEIAPITQDYGTAITAPAAPYKSGYAFQGWNAEIPATMPATDMTFTALWKYIYSGWLTDDIGTTYLLNGQIAYYAQWANIDGNYYYFNSEGYIAKGLYQTWSLDDSYEATFLFDDETGIFRQDLTTIYESGEKLYYVCNGEVVNYPGLVRIVKDDGEINYYYFGADNEAVRGGTYEVTQVNDHLLPADSYTFDENGVIVHHEDTSRNGIHEENGLKYYYIDGVKVHVGLVEIDGDYYYAANGGEIICGRTYWITKTNDLLPEKAYIFDAEGKIVFESEEPEDPTDPTDPTEPDETVPDEILKNGIYAEDGSLFYYEDGERTFAGLIELNGYYYYAKSNGEIIHGRSYWITKTNDLLPEKSYAFDDQGRLILAEETEPTEPAPTDPVEPEDPTEPLKNGIYAEDGSLYYYEDGERTYAGLIEIDGYYYYVRTSGEVVHGRSYWITKTNGLLPEKSYTFDEQGRMIDTMPEQADPQKNGIYAEDGSLYYYEDGLRTYAGLMEIDGYYYYAKTDGEVVNSRRYWITKTNDLMPETSYTFDEQGRMIIEEEEETTEPLKNGIYAEDGSLYYYEDGERTYAGLIVIDGYYYYIKSNCEAVHGCTYWITKTNDLLPAMNYTFDDQGRIADVRPNDFDTSKNGIYEENGTLYYYVDGYKTNAGLIQIDGDYYYAKSDGAIVTGRKYYVAKTNGLMAAGYYTFDADGKMVQ